MNDNKHASPAFSIQMRGYDQREVDAFLTQLAVSPDLALPAFAQRMRGYSVQQVNAYIASVKSQARP